MGRLREMKMLRSYVSSQLLLCTIFCSIKDAEFWKNHREIRAYESSRAYEFTTPNTPISTRPTRLAWSEKDHFRIPYIYAHCFGIPTFALVALLVCSEQWIFEVFSGYVAGNSNKIGLSIVFYHAIILIPTFVSFKECEFYSLERRVISLKDIF
jgi:hypothetical protein